MASWIRQIGAGALLSWLCVTSASAQNPTWVSISGNVQLADGTPLCAMVLANGQYMFSCDGTGSYALDVPLDASGEITLFSFADGFAPYSVILGPNRFPFAAFMDTAPPGSPLINMSQTTACAANNWVRVTGDIQSFGGDPLCAMVLANGQQMFTCGDSEGSFDLTVPSDENEEITLFGFADGFQPYRETFGAADCVRYAVVDGVEMEYHLRSDNSLGIDTCNLTLTATNTTSEKKTCLLNITLYRPDGTYLSVGSTAVNLPPGITDSGSGLLGGLGIGGCEDLGIGSWEPQESFPACIPGMF